MRQSGQAVLRFRDIPVEVVDHVLRDPNTQTEIGWMPRDHVIVQKQLHPHVRYRVFCPHPMTDAQLLSAIAQFEESMRWTR